MENLKQRASQMSLSDLSVLKTVMKDFYGEEISQTKNREDKANLISEEKKVASIIKEAMVSKATQIVLT